MAIFYVLPIPILIYWIHTARMGIQATDASVVGKEKTWNVAWLIFAGIIVYQSALWGIQSIFKQAIGLSPMCDYNPQPPYNDDDTNAVWFPKNNYYSFYEQSCTWASHKDKFYSHALTGPIVLMLGCFNFFKFSCGVVFSIDTHRWVGRIHNVIMFAAGIAALFLASITATPFFITIAFYILVIIWIPSMLLGWYFIRQGNVKQHQRWMTRNFACTAGAITLRLYNLLALGNTPYWIMVWLTMCHLPVVEAYQQYIDDCDRVWIASNIFGISINNNDINDNKTTTLESTIPTTTTGGAVVVQEVQMNPVINAK